MREKAGKIYEFENFRFETAEKTLFRDRKSVALTPKVGDLLALFVENRGRLLSKDELIAALWADSFVEEANLNVTVSALRRVLGEKPNENRFVETVPRRGYRFVAEVREIADAAAADRRTGPVLAEAETVSLALPAKSCPQCGKLYTDESLNFCLDDGRTLLPVNRPERRSAWFLKPLNARLPAAASGALLLIAASFLIWKLLFEPARPGVANVRTIAVLPFRPLAGNQSDGALEMGMADALITKLSGIRQITVRPTSAIAKYAQESTVDPLAAGRELQVEAVLDGKIQRDGNKIRVTVQLLRVADGATLWADSFDDFFTNIFAVQDSISEKTTSSLALKLSGREKEILAKRPTENTEAYALYLQGRYFHEQISEEGSRRAIEFYTAAVEKDPDYAMAYAWMTGPCLHLANLGIDRDENRQKARDSAESAVRIDPNLPDAHESLATVKDAIDWNWREAELEYRRAIELDPKNADAHFSYATFLSRFKSRLPEAIREIETAKQLNPVAIYMQAESVMILMRARRYDEAIDAAQKTIRLKPDFQPSYFYLTRLYAYRGMPAEAGATLKKIEEMTGSEQPFLRALIDRTSEKKPAAEKILRGLAAKYKEGQNCYQYALEYELLGDRDRAFEFLEKAYQRREISLVLLEVDPDWDELRTDPRFQELLRRVGLTAN